MYCAIQSQLDWIAQYIIKVLLLSKKSVMISNNICEIYSKKFIYANYHANNRQINIIHTAYSSFIILGWKESKISFILL